MNKERLTKSIIILLIIIFGTSILVRSLTSGQTVADYANENNIPTHTENVDNIEENEEVGK